MSAEEAGKDLLIQVLQIVEEVRGDLATQGAMIESLQDAMGKTQSAMASAQDAMGKAERAITGLHDANQGMRGSLGRMAKLLLETQDSAIKRFETLERRVAALEAHATK